MQELLEDSIFGKLFYNLDFRGISHNMILNCYGLRHLCIGILIQSMKGYPLNVCRNRHHFINGVMFPGNLCNSF